MSETITDRRIKSSLLDRQLDRFKEGSTAWSKIFSEILRELNITLDFAQKDQEGFSALRKRLNAEAGVVIANHPSTLDVLFVLSILERPDVLVMLQRKRFPFFEETFGTDYVIRSPKGEQELSKALRRIKKHIHDGGLAVIFPSGGEEMATGELSFKSGFTRLLPELQPEHMVYSFDIDAHTGKMINDDLIGPPRHDEMKKPFVLAPQLHVRPSKMGIEVSINESYSHVSEWQTLLDENIDLSPIGQNNLLTRHFLEKFKR